MSISISIVPSRTSGVGPLAVLFDASGTTCTETSYPFHDLFYLWNFGDASAGYWSTTGLSRNIAYDPIAAHIYEYAGNYTVTLTVITPSGDTLSNNSTTITVTDPDSYYSGSNTICFSTSGNFSGAPSGAQQITTSSWATVISYIATGRRLLLRRGESWSTSSDTNIGVNGPCTFGSFGPSAGVATITAGAQIDIFNVNGHSDWRFMDLKLIGPGGSPTAGGGLECGMGTTKLTAVRVEAYNHRVCTGSNHAQNNYCSELCFFESNFHHGNVNVGYLTSKKMMIIGTRFENNSGSSHVLRIPHIRPGVISNSIIRYPGGTRHALKLHNERDISGIDPGRWICINFCDFNESEGNGWCVAIGPQDNLAPEYVEDVIVRRNIVRAQQVGFYFANLQRVSCQNNVVIGMNLSGGSDDFDGIRVCYRDGSLATPSPDRNWVYNNTVYTVRTDTSNQYYSVAFRNGGSNHICRNTISSAPNFLYKDVIYIQGGVGCTQSNNTLTNTPGFENPGAENFHLVEGSVAIDAGYNEPTVYDDRDCARRTGMNDQGAYIFGEEEPEPPPTIPSQRMGRELKGLRKTSNFF